ncbi:integral membrane protein GPR137B-like [Elysia marginata]|uniref:Integral membrane protein GPR137B-like n=1 Tax=Elysia marginata TaxID=1093978 RepID=A0AAV4HXR9_9GAST|nr:integral membrane protein GPR137B-like [Elysia marginata]
MDQNLNLFDRPTGAYESLILNEYPATTQELLANSSSEIVTSYTTMQQLSAESTSHSSISTTTMPIIRPALPSKVELSLTIVYFVMFSLLFILVYAQLWMIWYYRHKRLSHQTIFLFTCLVWAGLRTTLFSFYFFDCKKANSLSVFFYWLLYSFPVCLQFSMLCLLLHFFAQIVLKACAKYEPGQYKVPLRAFLSLSVLAFIALNLAFAWLTCSNDAQYNSSSLKLVTIRVIATEAMFLLYGCVLSFCIYRMAKTASSHRVLEAKGTTLCQAMVTCIITTLLFLSRAVYNVITICPLTNKTTPTFGYDWINVTDQADALVGDLQHGLAYVSFGIVLFLWEVLPISMVVIFFRVKRLQVGLVPTDFSQQQHGRRVFFFDNPRRYDSEDDLSHHSGASQYYSEIGARHSVNGEVSRSWTPHSTPHGTPNLGTSWAVINRHNTDAVDPQALLASGAQAATDSKREKYGSFDSDIPKPQSGITPRYDIY